MIWMKSLTQLPEMSHKHCSVFVFKGFVQSWQWQLHRKGWCPPSSSLWLLLIKPLWPSSDLPSRPAAPLPETRESAKVTAYLFTDPNRTRCLTPVALWTAPTGLMEPEDQTLRVQNSSRLDPPKQSCKKIRNSGALQVFMTHTVSEPFCHCSPAGFHLTPPGWGHVGACVVISSSFTVKLDLILCLTFVRLV